MPVSFSCSPRRFLTLGIAATSLTAASIPAHAGDGGAIAAGILGGTALGFIAGAAVAGAPPPPPPPPVYYAPVYAPPPPRCWFEPQEVWTGYGYAVQQVRLCN